MLASLAVPRTGTGAMISLSAVGLVMLATGAVVSPPLRTVSSNWRTCGAGVLPFTGEPVAVTLTLCTPAAGATKVATPDTLSVSAAPSSVAPRVMVPPLPPLTSTVSVTVSPALAISGTSVAASSNGVGATLTLMLNDCVAASPAMSDTRTVTARAPTCAGVGAQLMRPVAGSMAMPAGAAVNA